MVRRVLLVALCLAALAGSARAQGRSAQGGRRPRPAAGPAVVLRPARVFDGINPGAHDGWAVVVRGDRIEAARPAGEIKAPEGARSIELPGMTLLPGLIDLHTHVLLHPYDEAVWNDQVLKEALALRVCRATNHLEEHAALRLHHDPRPAWAPKGPCTPTSGSSRPSTEGIVPGPEDAGRDPARRRGDRAATHAPRGSRRNGTFHKGRRRPTASTR